MLDVRRLRVLREVVNRGSFSAAAETLHLSQSAVSQQVAALEREVGMPLLERTSAGPKPTAAGSALLVHTDAVVARLEEAERELAEIAGLETGSLSLISFPSASATIVTRAVSVFRSRFPNVALRLGEAEPEDSIPALRRGEWDIALGFDFTEHPWELGRDVDSRLLLEEQLLVALPPGHPLAAADAVSMDELAGEEWLCGNSGSCREHVMRLCHGAGYDPNVTFESDDYSVLQGLVAAGLGVTLLPDLALRARHPGLELRPIRGNAPKRRVWSVTREAAARSPATDAMQDVLVEAAAEFHSEVADAVAA